MRLDTTATHWPGNGRFGTTIAPLLGGQALPLEEALSAVWLDDKDAMAHAVLAHIRIWGSDWEGAIGEARKAVALNPNGAFGIAMLGCVLGFGGYRKEALERLRQTVRLSPHDPLLSLWLLWIGLIHFYAREFSAAVENLRQVGRLRPYYNNHHAVLVAALAFQGYPEDAREVLRRATWILGIRTHLGCGLKMSRSAWRGSGPQPATLIESS